MLGPRPGTTSEALYLETRITVTTEDSKPGTQQLLCGETSIGGTVCATARTGLWEPRVATPEATWPDAS